MKFFFLGENHASVAGGDHFGCIKGENRKVSIGTQFLSAAFRTQSLRTVLNHRNTKGFNFDDVGRKSEGVIDDNSARSLGQLLPDLVRRRTHSNRVHIHENRPGTDILKGVTKRRTNIGGKNDFLHGPDIKRQQGQMKGSGAGGNDGCRGLVEMGGSGVLEVVS